MSNEELRSDIAMSRRGVPRKRLSPEFSPGVNPSAQALLNLLSPYKHVIGMLPFFFFAFESLLALLCRTLYADSDWMVKMMFAQLLAVNTTFAGLLHFFPPLYHFYASMIFLPWPHVWLYMSGLMLITGGLCVAFMRTQILGAWLLVSTLVLVFPGNIACVVSPRPRNQVCGGSLVGALMRLPFQFTFIAWAWWFTSPTLLSTL